MCGILGRYKVAIEKKRFEACLERMTHRGPDGFGIWNSPEGICTLGHKRLSILDLSDAGKQPMHSADDRYVITFNGEIYNYVELKEELKQKGYSFKSNCDTEVILCAYKEWGEACLSKMNGMWAFVIYDKLEQTLFMSRDRFGVKPLFYAYVDDGIVFGSEMKALIPMLPKATPNKHLIGHKTKIIRYEYTEECLIEEIRRFPAGCYAKVVGNEVKPVKWWETLDHLVDAPKKYEEQCEVFRELFLDACRIRMRSDVTIGTALSGGLDSSATICSMAHIIQNGNDGTVNPDNQHAFIAKFPGTTLDESYYADKVTEKLGINSTDVYVDPIKGLENMAQYMYDFEEVYYTSPVPMMQTYAALREENVLVTLDGHGADELWGGYQGDLLYALLDCEHDENAAKQIIDTYRNCFDKKMNPGIHQKADKKIAQKFKMEYAARKVLGLNADKKYLKDVKGFDRLSHFNRVLYNDFHVTILPTLLRNYDHYSMASGVEIRMPFMDHRLVSMAFSLEWDSKLRGGFTKSIVRDALGDIMPQEVVNRRTKFGFNTPVVEWMKGPWKEFLLDCVHSQSFRNCDLLKTKQVRKEIEEMMVNDSINYWQAEVIWTHFMPYLWEQYFYKRAIDLC